MTRTLVVVESPAKAKTIEKYLGADYIVRASVGHIVDLPKNDLAVDVDDEFAVTYVVPEDSKRHVAELKRALKQVDDLVLATDYDREGEAIAFHVATQLGTDPATTKRVTFTEITRDAILEAFGHPRTVDLRLVDAQEARRILDRLVGYQISPILWRKVRPGLSAGRVQSPAVRLIVEREREISAFDAVEYWSVDVSVTPHGPPQPFRARLAEIPKGRLAASPDKKGVVLTTGEEAAKLEQALRRASYRVTSVESKERKRTPAAPFTTSTLQQEAARKLGFGARRTMQIAQRLYEGVAVPGEGSVGLITYMRTDSVNLAESAIAEIRALIAQDHGDGYVLPEPRRYKKKQRNAQEAHEAIRPTSVMRTPQRVASTLDRDQLRLYDLIWKRTVATQMADARFSQVGVDIQAMDGSTPYGLRATGQTLLFDGFIRLYTEGRDEGPDEDAEARLPVLTPEQPLSVLDVLPEQHFTQPPPRFSEATLVKTLEENGIGRPSTYASIISRIQDAGYVKLEERRFYPHDIAYVVVDGLVQHFPDIVDIGFTAEMEEELDEIAEGQRTRTQVLRTFYDPFSRAVERAAEKWDRYIEDIDEDCPRCLEEGRTLAGHLQKRLGRFGFFIGCSRFAEEDGGCKYIRNLNGAAFPEPEDLDEVCPDCGSGLQKKFGRYGEFVGCSNWPDCKYIKKEPPKSTGVACPECGVGELVERRNRFGQVFFSCGRYPDCECAVSNPPISDSPCPECGGLLLQRPKSERCWRCGAEFDLDMNLKKPGDVEAETAAREAKKTARAVRAAAKKKTTAKKTAAKKKTTAKRKTAAKKKTTAKKVAAKRAGASADQAGGGAPVEAGREDSTGGD